MYENETENGKWEASRGSTKYQVGIPSEGTENQLPYDKPTANKQQKLQLLQQFQNSNWISVIETINDLTLYYISFSLTLTD